MDQNWKCVIKNCRDLWHVLTTEANVFPPGGEVQHGEGYNRGGHGKYGWLHKTNQVGVFGIQEPLENEPLYNVPNKSLFDPFSHCQSKERNERFDAVKSDPIMPSTSMESFKKRCINRVLATYLTLRKWWLVDKKAFVLVALPREGPPEMYNKSKGIKFNDHTNINSNPLIKK